MSNKHTQGKVYVHLTDKDCVMVEISGGRQARIADCGSEFLTGDGENEANAERIAMLLNAGQGKTNEQTVELLTKSNIVHIREDGTKVKAKDAIRYIANGATWDSMIEGIVEAVNDDSISAHDVLIKISGILAKLEG